jgi:hypothetical protein
METSFNVRCEILADLWMSYRDDEEFGDFMSYNDLGLPMAYIVANELGSVNEVGVRFIDEGWNLLLAALKLDDTGFESLDDILAAAPEQEEI